MFHIHPSGGRPVTKERFELELDKLQPELLNAHFSLKETRRRVVVVIGGIEGAGKGEVVWQINQWLDPRGVETHGSLHPGDGVNGRPAFWRHNLALPARGRVGVHFGAWYSDVILHRLGGDLKRKTFEACLETIRRFERMLAADGTVFLKLWLSISRKTLKERLKDLAANPELHLTLLPVGRQLVERHDDLVEIAEQTMQRTHLPEAPWHLIDATDRRRRRLVVARLLMETLRRADEPPPKTTRAKPDARRRAQKFNALAEADLNVRLEKADYEEKLEKLQHRLLKLAWTMFKKKRSCLLVFEGWDAAGKGGAIRRVTQALDPRLYQVTGFAAPTEEEKAQHYLWRFWRRLPPSGLTAIFDRSHYGRVLVERVEGFAKPEEWQRAYGEINDFEAQLIDGGYIIRKFWLHISPEEQLRRFKQRERIRIKRYKITKEDWRNRAKWKPYEEAVNEMVARTGPGCAPWTVVPANDKKFARIAVLKTVCEALEGALG
jgi:polyphosphate:AMP phosphotransferase